jgi:hypothetical protein
MNLLELLAGESCVLMYREAIQPIEKYSLFPCASRKSDLVVQIYRLRGGRFVLGEALFGHEVLESTLVRQGRINLERYR